jgi:predicted Zn-dependent protease
MRKRLISLLAGFALAATPVLATPSEGAQAFPSIIRDAEIETTIRDYTTPIFTAAGLDAKAVHVYLLQSDQINAFVAGGMNVFIFTGLIIATQRPLQLIGVVAHETGHIAGGHLARIQEGLRGATITGIIAMVLGGIAAAASGNAGAAAGGLLAGQDMAQRSILNYTRVMEASADAAALKFLDATHQSSRGLLEFFGILQQQQQMLFGQPNPYLINHPLTSDRIDAVQQHVDRSPYSNSPDRPDWVIRHKRMVAKLIGFIWPLPRVLQSYPESDKSVYGRYARAIAYYRIGLLARSLPLIDGLIAEQPEDPYFQELKGQMLYENGRGSEALAYYQKALALAPDQPLLSLELAEVQIEQYDPSLIKPAIAELQQSLQADPQNAYGWRLLGTAYGRDGQMGMAALSLAEAAAANGRAKNARDQANQAIGLLPVGSPAWLRAQDILTTMKPDNASSDDTALPLQQSPDGQ